MSAMAQPPATSSLRLAVLGAGAWGTAIAVALSRKHQVVLWARDPQLAAEIKRTRENARYLPTARLAHSIELTAELDAALSADVVILATATAGLQPTLSDLIARADGNFQRPLIWLCKGFVQTPESIRLPHEVVRAMLPDNARFGVLSGPSFADEVVAGLPVALTLASPDLDFAKETAIALNGHALRVYASSDIIGVELGGALKNVMAIAAGICDGLQLGLNARAALVTRGLAEMVRLGVAMGGKAETFMGLTGVGDLILTATGNLSRNRRVGLAVATGASLSQVLADLGHVAEGVPSARATLALARRYQVEMPITEAVNAVLFEGASAANAVQQLLARDVRVEGASATT